MAIYDFVLLRGNEYGLLQALMLKIAYLCGFPVISAVGLCRAANPVGRYANPTYDSGTSSWVSSSNSAMSRFSASELSSTVSPGP